MDTGEARQACSVRAPPRNVQQRMHAGCDNSGKKVFSNLAKEVNRNMFIESAKVQQPLSGAVRHSRRHFSVIGQLSLRRKQTAGHFGFNELSLNGSGIPSNTFLINLPAVPVSENPRQPASPLSHPTEISQASAQALHPYSLFPWQVMISAIRRIPQTNTSDISLLQDGLIKWTNFPTEESLRVTRSLVDLASCNLWDVWLVT